MIIYTDGACSGNPGSGGWATILFHEGRVWELGGGEKMTTNNRMELQGILQALKWMNKKKIEGKISIYSDSLYCLRAITQWSFGWKKKNWKTQNGQDVSNKDLLEEALDEIKTLPKIHWGYCRGHQGHPGNERCDEIAVGFSKGQYVDLFEGPYKNYSVDLDQVPPDEPWPESNSSKEKKVVLSYLSLVNGVLQRHPDWKSCEARVKGVPGAKFKKAHSTDEEKTIVQGWGVDPKKLVY